MQDRVTVSVRTRYTVGRSVIPKTKTMRGEATATAVIKFQCSPKVKDVPGSEPGPDGADDTRNQGGEPNLPIITLDCDGLRNGLKINPADPEPWKKLAKTIFAVHLIDD